MPYFHLKQSTKHLTSTAGLLLVGECFAVAELDRLDQQMWKRGRIRWSDLVKTYVGLLTLGKSDFEAAEAYRTDRFFKDALGIQQMPGSVWLRQSLEGHADRLREHTDALSVRLLRRVGVPITADAGLVCLDFDTFVMDNSQTKKECVGRTYQGVDGYTPIAAYLGNEGWCVGLELRPGVQHSALETHYFLERVLPRVRDLVDPAQPVLARSDSGFDSAQLLFQQDDEKRAWAADGRTFEYLVKWNPRKQDLEAWAARAEEAGAFREVRPGKRVALLDLRTERSFGGDIRTFRQVIRLTERTIDRRGQRLLLPELTLEGWWTSLETPPEDVIARYERHGTHEQFHSEIKTDLDLERLPSGKFDCNDLVLHLGLFAYNILRLIGQTGLTGDLAPVRHPAKRRRLKTVLQEVMYRAAHYMRKARQRIVDFGRSGPVASIFAVVRDELRAAQGFP